MPAEVELFKCELHPAPRDGWRGGCDKDDHYICISWAGEVERIASEGRALKAALVFASQHGLNLDAWPELRALLDLSN